MHSVQYSKNSEIQKFVVEKLILNAAWEIMFRKIKDLGQNAPNHLSSQGPDMLVITQPLSFLWIPELEQLLSSAAQTASRIPIVCIVVVYFS